MLRITALLGRTDERAEIELMLDRVVVGPVGLALEGSPGIGKTTLLHDAVDSARQHDHDVIATSPGEPDASLAFAGLGDLLDGMPESVLKSLPDPQRRALAAALLMEDAVTPVDAQALPRAVLSVVRELSQARPLMVAIDDEQWLDRPSARVLAFALNRLRTEPVCVLLARRPNSNGALWPELARGFPPAGLPSRLVGPLSLRALHDMLSADDDRVIPRPLMRRIHEASGGNPLYALAIAREIRRADPDEISDALPIPATLADAMARRLNRLPPDSADPLFVVAARSEATVADIQAVLPDFRLTQLDAAERAGVIAITADRVRFTHPLLASTHSERISAPRRRELHRRLAGVVSGEESRAHHAALGAEAPDRSLAVGLEHAAGAAARRGAPEVAAQLLEKACRLTPAVADDARRSRAVAAAEHHITAGDRARARTILEETLAELAAGPIRARALLLLGQIRMDDFDAAAALAKNALTEAAAHPRVSAQAQLLLSELWANRGDAALAVTHAREAVALAERTEDRGLLAQMLSIEGVTAFFNGYGVQRDLMTRAIEFQDDADDVPSYRVPSTSLGCQLFWSDDLDAARPLLERSLGRATERGEENDRAALHFHLAHLEWEAGNNEIAARYTREVIEATRQLVDDQAESYALWLQAFVASRRGNLTDAREYGRRAVVVAERIGDVFISSFASSILAATDLWSGDPQAAHTQLAPLREALLSGERGFVGSLTLVFWSLDVEALIALRHFDEAADVLAELSERASSAANPNAIAIAHRCRGLLAAAQGDTDDALDAMTHALAEHHRRPLPLEVGRTMLETGTLHRRAKRKTDAKRSLEEALTRLEGVQAMVWARRARDELGRIGLRRAAPSEGLTPTQARVAELVASGMTNRAIADTLFMSLRTVETHLTKVYRELGITSRTQLAAALAAGSTLHAPAEGTGAPSPQPYL